MYSLLAGGQHGVLLKCNISVDTLPLHLTECNGDPMLSFAVFEFVTIFALI
jgi:hypothetical protein